MLAGQQWIQYYSGFMMANNCNLFSQNGLTQDYNQVCGPARLSRVRNGSQWLLSSSAMADTPAVRL